MDDFFQNVIQFWFKVWFAVSENETKKLIIKKLVLKDSTVWHHKCGAEETLTAGLVVPPLPFPIVSISSMQRRVSEVWLSLPMARFNFLSSLISFRLKSGNVLVAVAELPGVVANNETAGMSRHLLGGCEGRLYWGAVGGLALALTRMLHCLSRILRSGLIP